MDDIDDVFAFQCLPKITEYDVISRSSFRLVDLRGFVGTVDGEGFIVTQSKES